MEFQAVRVLFIGETMLDPKYLDYLKQLYTDSPIKLTDSCMQLRSSTPCACWQLRFLQYPGWIYNSYFWCYQDPDKWISGQLPKPFQCRIFPRAFHTWPKALKIALATRLQLIDDTQDFFLAQHLTLKQNCLYYFSQPGEWDDVP